jgi:hypothetical protein
MLRRTRTALVEQFPCEAFDPIQPGMWPVKWLLLIPHYIILVSLCLAL